MKTFKLIHEQGENVIATSKVTQVCRPKSELDKLTLMFSNGDWHVYKFASEALRNVAFYEVVKALKDAFD